MKQGGCNGGFPMGNMIYAGGYGSGSPMSTIWGNNPETLTTTNICAEGVYPFTSGSSGPQCGSPSCQHSAASAGICKSHVVSSCPTSVSVTSFRDIKLDDQSLMAAIAERPVSITIAAECAPFNNYAGGILDTPECAGGKIDHAVLAVGYGTDAGKDYWLIKNSWGTKWGENGYVKVARGKNMLCINCKGGSTNMALGVKLYGPPGPSGLAPPPPPPLPKGTEPYANPTVDQCSDGTYDMQTFSKFLNGGIVPCNAKCSNSGALGAGSGCPENPYATHTPKHHQGWCAFSHGPQSYCVIACLPGAEPCGNGMVCHAPGPGYYGMCHYPKA
jgi:hypothetical protein